MNVRDTPNASEDLIAGSKSDLAPPFYEERRKRLQHYATWSEEEAAEFDKNLAFQRQIDLDTLR